MNAHEKDLALLTAKLEAPIAIAAILDGQTALNEDVCYGLHEMISNFEPDTALLAIAAGTKKILGVYKGSAPGMIILGVECDRILDEYGDLWIRNARGQNLETDEIHRVLTYTAEDLEGLAELLEMNRELLEASEPAAGELCEILHIQARAHSLVAEAFMEAAEAAIHEEEQKNAAVKPVIHVARAGTSNVIPFPVQARTA